MWDSTCSRVWHHVDTVLYNLKQEVMRATAAGHLTGRLPGAAAEPRLQVPVGQQQLQRLGGVCLGGAGVWSGQVKWREAAIGLSVELGSSLQEETPHGDAAPPAGAVQGRPAIGGAGVHPGASGEQSTNSLHVAAVGCTVQGGVPVRIAAVHQQRVSW